MFFKHALKSSKNNLLCDILTFLTFFKAFSYFFLSFWEIKAVICFSYHCYVFIKKHEKNTFDLRPCVFRTRQVFLSIASIFLVDDVL